jgi:hypothetical protein
VAKFLPENLTLTAKFEETEFYLPASTEKNISLEFTATLLLLIPLASPIAAVVAALFTQRLVRKRQTPKQLSVVETTKEEEKAEEEIIDIPQELQPIRIIFPDIKTQFPHVWGINEKLHIQIIVNPSVLKNVEEESIMVSIDGETVASLPFSLQEPTEFSYQFTRKGKHGIRVTSGKVDEDQRITKVEIRIVDYAEENVRLYNEFLKRLTEHGFQLRSDMTAKDVENLISSTPDYDLALLDKVTYCFEKAEYSNHPTLRQDYEILYQALKELKIDVK